MRKFTTKVDDLDYVAISNICTTEKITQRELVHKMLALYLANNGLLAPDRDVSAEVSSLNKFPPQTAA